MGVYRTQAAGETLESSRVMSGGKRVFSSSNTLRLNRLNNFPMVLIYKTIRDNCFVGLAGPEIHEQFIEPSKFQDINI